jgi:hypothetical protein
MYPQAERYKSFQRKDFGSNRGAASFFWVSGTPAADFGMIAAITITHKTCGTEI